jgi:hypothetical protein
MWQLAATLARYEDAPFRPGIRPVAGGTTRRSDGQERRLQHRPGRLGSGREALPRARPDGGPTIRALEGNVWGIPKLGWIARFASTEEAEHVLLASVRCGRKRVQGLKQGPQPRPDKTTDLKNSVTQTP